MVREKGSGNMKEKEDCKELIFLVALCITTVVVLFFLILL